MKKLEKKKGKKWAPLGGGREKRVGDTSVRKDRWGREQKCLLLLYSIRNARS